MNTRCAWAAVLANRLCAPPRGQPPARTCGRLRAAQPRRAGAPARMWRAVNLAAARVGRSSRNGRPAVGRQGRFGPPGGPSGRPSASARSEGALPVAPSFGERGGLCGKGPGLLRRAPPTAALVVETALLDRPPAIPRRPSAGGRGRGLDLLARGRGDAVAQPPATTCPSWAPAGAPGGATREVILGGGPRRRRCLTPTKRYGSTWRAVDSTCRRSTQSGLWGGADQQRRHLWRTRRYSWGAALREPPAAQRVATCGRKGRPQGLLTDAAAGDKSEKIQVLAVL